MVAASRPAARLATLCAVTRLHFHSQWLSRRATRRLRSEYPVLHQEVKHNTVAHLSAASPKEQRWLWEWLDRIYRGVVTGVMAVAAAVSVSIVWAGTSIWWLVTWPLGMDEHRNAFGFMFRRSLSMVALDLNPLWRACVEEGDVPMAPPPGRCIFVCNHSSLSDVVVLGRFLPFEVKYLSMGAMRKFPGVGRMMATAGDVFVDFRKRPSDGKWETTNAEEAVAQCTAIVEQGMTPLCIFPEGGLTRDGRIKPFKKGAFKIAVETGACIVPMALWGTHEMLPPDSNILHWGTARIKVGKPIPTRGLTVDQARTMAQRAVQELRDELEHREVLEVMVSEKEAGPQNSRHNYNAQLT